MHQLGGSGADVCALSAAWHRLSLRWCSTVGSRSRVLQSRSIRDAKNVTHAVRTVRLHLCVFLQGLGWRDRVDVAGQGAGFVEQARVWQRRFGGNVYCQMPMAVSCLAAFKCASNTPQHFRLRLLRLQQVMALLSAPVTSPSPSPSLTSSASLTACASSASISSVLRFDPAVPEVCMVHGYLCMSVQRALRLRDEVLADTGISCFGRVRPATNNHNHSDSSSSTGLEPEACCFEMNMVSQMFISRISVVISLVTLSWVF